MKKLTPENARPGTAFTTEKSLGPAGIIVGHPYPDPVWAGGPMWWVPAISMSELKGTPKTTGWIDRIHVSNDETTKWLVWEVE